MPTYEYLCNTCEHRFDYFQSMNDAKLEQCPRCGAALRRLIGAGAGIIFKGSGFYCTDYRSASEAAKYAGADKADKSNKADTSAAGNNKSSAAS